MKKILLTLSFLILTFIFSYKVSNFALLSYDEAWYAEISRNILLTSNPFKLIFNGTIFTDHPPIGYWFMSFFMMVFGDNEFGIRFFSIISGAATLVLMFLIGKKIKNNYVGIMASLMLFSSMWFVLRVRSGNLDVPFLFFETLTVYLLLKIKENKKYLYLASASFAFLFLTKTLLAIGLLPLFFFIYLYEKNNLKIKEIFIAKIIFFVIVLPWYIYNQYLSNDFLYHHFIEIGLRGDKNSFSFATLQQNFLYLRIGIGKWYKIFLLGILLISFNFFKNIYLSFTSKRSVNNFVFLINEKTSKYNIILISWFLGFSIFLVSSKTEIWHLLPLYPPLFLLTSYNLFLFLENLFSIKKLFEIAKLNISSVKFIQNMTKYLLLIFVIFLSFYQFKQFSNLTYFKETIFSGEKDISIKAGLVMRSGKYSNLHIMEPFMPSAIFYSKSNILQLHLEPNAYQRMTQMLQQKTKDVFIISKNTKNDLDRDKVDYIVLEENEFYFVIGNR